MPLKFSVFIYVSFSVLRVVFHSFFFCFYVFLLFSSVLVLVLFRFVCLFVCLFVCFFVFFFIFLPKPTTILEKSYNLLRQFQKFFPLYLDKPVTTTTASGRFSHSLTFSDDPKGLNRVLRTPQVPCL